MQKQFLSKFCPGNRAEPTQSYTKIFFSAGNFLWWGVSVLATGKIKPHNSWDKLT